MGEDNMIDMHKTNKTKKQGKWAECHTGNPLAFTTHDGIKVYAGGSSRAGGWWLMDETPDLAMGPDNEVMKGMPSKYSTRGLDAEKWSCMSKIEQVEPKEILAIDFPDYKVPQDLGKEFWGELVENIRENEIKTIHCMCMGGHGRTGVQLSILRYLLASDKEREAWKDSNELITEVRDNYCQKAVEATAQQQYVADMCGIEMGPTLGFHKGYNQTGYGTGTGGWKKTTAAKTNYNIKLVECTICDFVSWENTSEEILKDEWCYDVKCNGKLVDVSPFVIKRDTTTNSTDHCMCLNCLQPVSDLQVMSINHLSEELMTTLHGEEWRDLLESQMKLNSVNTCKGNLLRNLSSCFSDDPIWSNMAKEAGDEKKMPENMVVVESCIQCNIGMKDRSEVPNYTKGDRGFVHHVKCDYCFKKLSPHILTMALDLKNNTTLKACPECINKSKDASFFFTNQMKKDDGLILDGVSPQHWYRLTNRKGWPDDPNPPKQGQTTEEDTGPTNATTTDEDDYNVV